MRYLQQQRGTRAEHRPRVTRAPPRDALRPDGEPHRLLRLRENVCHRYSFLDVSTTRWVSDAARAAIVTR
jgi:hypothetical protein